MVAKKAAKKKSAKKASKKKTVVKGKAKSKSSQKKKTPTKKPSKKKSAAKTKVSNKKKVVSREPKKKSTKIATVKKSTSKTLKKSASKGQSSAKTIKKESPAPAKTKSNKKGVQGKVSQSKRDGSKVSASKVSEKAKGKKPVTSKPATKLSASVKKVSQAIAAKTSRVASGIREGQQAPQFALLDRRGVVYDLKQIATKFTVVYFYPRDNTPGCTLQAKGFNRDLEKFRKLNTTLLGISGGDRASKELFCKRNNLKIALLSDPGFKVSEKYEACGQKMFMGRKYHGIFRKTFVLDKNKKIIKIFDKVKPEGHSKEVRDFIQNFSGN